MVLGMARKFYEIVIAAQAGIFKLLKFKGIFLKRYPLARV